MQRENQRIESVSRFSCRFAKLLSLLVDLVGIGVFWQLILRKLLILKRYIFSQFPPFTGRLYVFCTKFFLGWEKCQFKSRCDTVLLRADGTEFRSDGDSNVPNLTVSS